MFLAVLPGGGHLPECKYVPLQCPNLCGVTYEHDFMEDRMKMCGAGCDDWFRREDQDLVGGFERTRLTDMAC